MSKRKNLVMVVLSLLAFGIAAIVYVFVKSLSPHDQAGATLPRINIADVPFGVVVVLADPRWDYEYYYGFRPGLLIYKNKYGKIRVWAAPIKGTAIGMPEFKWMRPMYQPCYNFGPVKVNGVVDESKGLTCHDPAANFMGLAEELSWTTGGKNLGKMTEDMIPVTGLIEGDYFIIGKDL